MVDYLGNFCQNKTLIYTFQLFWDPYTSNFRGGSEAFKIMTNDCYIYWRKMEQINTYPLSNKQRPWQIGVGKGVWTSKWWFSGSLFSLLQLLECKRQTGWICHCSFRFAQTCRDESPPNHIELPLRRAILAEVESFTSLKAVNLS